MCVCVCVYIYIYCNLLTLKCGTSNTNSPSVDDSG